MSVPYTRTVAFRRAQAYTVLAELIGDPTREMVLEHFKKYGFQALRDVLEWLELTDLTEDLRQLQLKLDQPDEPNERNKRNERNERDKRDLIRVVERMAFLCHQEALAWKTAEMEGVEAWLWEQHKTLGYLRSLLERKDETTSSLDRRLVRIAREYAVRDGLLVNLLLQAIREEQSRAMTP